GGRRLLVRGGRGRRPTVHLPRVRRTHRVLVTGSRAVGDDRQKRPPSTRNDWAVQAPPSSAARNSTIWANSSGEIRFFRAWSAIVPASPSGDHHFSSWRVVGTHPGSTEFTRTLLGPKVRAMVRVMPSTADLAMA